MVVKIGEEGEDTLAWSAFLDSSSFSLFIGSFRLIHLVARFAA
jgi:hypothetical protein